MLPVVEELSIIRLPDASVKESKNRVVAALYANDCEVLDRKIVIHLSPAEQRKNNPIFYLVMAIGIMKEAGKITNPISKDTAFLGVLSLGGSIKPVEGMLPAIINHFLSKRKYLYVPPMVEIPLAT